MSMSGNTSSDRRIFIKDDCQLIKSSPLLKMQTGQESLDIQGILTGFSKLGFVWNITMLNATYSSDNNKNTRS
jgi:hypothetical protein